MRVLVTGGAGFIAHHVIEHLLRNTDWEIVCLDRLDTSGNLNRLAEVIALRPDRTRIKIVHHDLRASLSSLLRQQIGKINMVWHLAAATHVDRSIEDPLSFVYDNVVATCNLLEYARRLDMLDWFLFFSTDEVFGPAPGDSRYQEWDRYRSGNPYAATKAGAEELCVAYENTYRMPISITHTMNVIGERQHFEKFVPATITKVRDGEIVTIHANKELTQPGSRCYIHARNVADALLFLVNHHVNGEKYNIVGDKELNNLEMAKLIAELMEHELYYSLVSWHESRPGHDLRYALSGDKMKALGWTSPVSFEHSLERTVRWFLKNQTWLGARTENLIERPGLVNK